MPTVEQVWHRVMPRGTELINGETGIYNQVSWVVTLRPTPPGFDRLRGSELALIDANIAEKLGVTPLSLVSSLVEQGISSLGVLGETPDDVIKYTGTRKIPLLRLPSAVDLTVLEGSITRLIREERDRLYQKEQDLTSTLMDLALAGRGMNAILDKLQELTGRTVVLLNRNFKPRTFTSEAQLTGLQPALLKEIPFPSVGNYRRKALGSFFLFCQSGLGKARRRGIFTGRYPPRRT